MWISWTIRVVPKQVCHVIVVQQEAFGSISFHIYPQWVKDICWLSRRGNCLTIPACSCICLRLLLPSPSRASSYFILVLFLFIYVFGSFLFETWLSSVRLWLGSVCVCLCALLVVIITSVSQVSAAQHPLASTSTHPSFPPLRPDTRVNCAKWCSVTRWLPLSPPPQTANLIHTLHNNIYYHLSALDLPPAPTCHRLPQLATRGISFNFHVFFGVLLLGSLFALPLLFLLFFSIFFYMLLRQFHLLFSPRRTLFFSRGIINIYAWIGDNKHADIPSILHLPPPCPSSALSFPLLFGAIWSICLATSCWSKCITNIGNTLPNGIQFDSMTQIW